MFQMNQHRNPHSQESEAEPVSTNLNGLVNDTINNDMWIEVPPQTPDYEDFYVDFTDDSDESLFCTKEMGRTDKIGGKNVALNIRFEPGPDYEEGQYEGTLCFILPDHPEKNIYYKITANLMLGGNA